VKGRGIGYDYVHVAIDDHTRVGYVEVLPDQKGATAAGFLTRAAGLIRGTLPLSACPHRCGNGLLAFF